MPDRHDSDLECPLRQTLWVLREYLPELVLIGGWVPELYRRYGGFAGWSSRSSYTTKLDVLVEADAAAIAAGNAAARASLRTARTCLATAIDHDLTPVADMLLPGTGSPRVPRWRTCWGTSPTSATCWTRSAPIERSADGPADQLEWSCTISHRPPTRSITSDVGPRATVESPREST